MSFRHITRFTYKFTSFQGWRVAIRRCGYTLTRYFSDRQYADSDIAFEHALQFRDTVLAELEQNPGNEIEVLNRYRAEARTVYPAGLKPAIPPQKAESSTGSACSVRSNKVMQGILKKVCNRLQLDTASVLKLSLYLFTLQYGHAGAATRSMTDAPLIREQEQVNSEHTDDMQLYLHKLIADLESAGLNMGLPSFEEFATGKCSNKEQMQAAVALLAQAPMEPPQNMRPPRPSPPSVTIPERLDRSSISYFKHFYNSPRKQLTLPIPPIAYSPPHNGITAQHHPDLAQASAPPPKRFKRG